MSRELLRRIEKLEEENRRLRGFSQSMNSAAEESRKLRRELERQRRERDFDWDIGY